MQRITLAILERKIDYLNKLTDSPATAYTITGRPAAFKTVYLANIGNYHRSGAYGGHYLYRIVNESGGVTDVFGCGHLSKRELAERIDAYIAGYEAASAT